MDETALKSSLTQCLQRLCGDAVPFRSWARVSGTLTLCSDSELSHGVIIHVDEDFTKSNDAVYSLKANSHAEINVSVKCENIETEGDANANSRAENNVSVKCENKETEGVAKNFGNVTNFGDLNVNSECVNAFPGFGCAPVQDSVGESRSEDASTSPIAQAGSENDISSLTSTHDIFVNDVYSNSLSRKRKRSDSTFTLDVSFSCLSEAETLSRRKRKLRYQGIVCETIKKKESSDTVAKKKSTETKKSSEVQVGDGKWCCFFRCTKKNQLETCVLSQTAATSVMNSTENQATHDSNQALDGSTVISEPRYSLKFKDKMNVGTENSISEQTTVFKCPMSSSAEFKTFVDFRNHMTTKHRSRKACPYCPFCYQKGTLTAMRVHILTHHEAYIHNTSCLYCNFKGKSVYSLLHHVRDKHFIY